MKWLQFILNTWLRYNQNRQQVSITSTYLIGILLSIAVIIISVIYSIPLGFALMGVWGIMAYALYRTGYPLKELLNLSWKGGKTSLIVVQIFLLIGWLIAMWQASGVIPMIISLSVDWINPDVFIASAFLLTSVVSLLLGTSLGTVGTIGIVLITIARAGNIPEDIVAGAIIAGAYVGDRNSPLSSSAALIASLTHTNIASNVRIMFKDSIPALILCTVVYLLLSQWLPLHYTNSLLSDTIHFVFNINWTLWIPIIIIIGVLPFKVSIRWPIAISALVAGILAYTAQGHSIAQIAQFSLTGFTLPAYNPLADIIHGGGLTSMAMAAYSIFLACSISGMLEGVGFWNGIRQLLDKAQSRSDMFAANAILSYITGAIGCSQSISTVMTHSIMRTTYAQRRIQDEEVMLDFENSGIVIAALQPWNIAGYVPTLLLGTSMTGYLPYACFLYILPLVYWLRLRRHDRVQH